MKYLFFTCYVHFSKWKPQIWWNIYKKWNKCKYKKELSLTCSICDNIFLATSTIIFTFIKAWVFLFQIPSFNFKDIPNHNFFHFSFTTGHIQIVFKVFLYSKFLLEVYKNPKLHVSEIIYSDTFIIFRA